MGSEKAFAAFKEWEIVCQALEAGRQTILLRKGGLSEGRGGFAFSHESFFLFPTHYHEQLELTRWRPDTHPGLHAETTSGSIILEAYCRIRWSTTLEDWGKICLLEPEHIWKEEVVRKRFEDKGSNILHLAFVEVLKLETPLTLPLHKSYGGCCSWIDLEDLTEWPPMQPVLEEEILEAHLKRVKKWVE